MTDYSLLVSTVRAAPSARAIRRRRAAKEIRRDGGVGVGVTTLLSALLAIPPLSTDITLPAMPSIASAFGEDASRIQLVVVLFLAGFAIGLSWSLFLHAVALREIHGLTSLKSLAVVAFPIALVAVKLW